ncbi:hypothetical protein H70357_26365 [Paenibacillus sp. FSL H7-0357]|nr:YafY family protein [Paenibacillus sp. FSL H7-0357]AIQ19842.1 hypothetical protein H70357_26365 [Paenibacillus sp. FSL H7-0357]
MNKAQRLIQLIMLVNERRKFTIQELADECGVSRRTMIRDLTELSELGVPLYSQVGAHGGYRVLREKVLPPISFTEYEAMALFFACQSLRNYKSLPFDNEVNTALQKLMHYLSDDRKSAIERMQERLVFWIPPHDLDLPCLRDLLEAALEQHTVRILYEAKKRSERTIQPLGVYTVNGLWYCRAYCEVVKDMRVFRVDRVKACVPAADSSPRYNPTHYEANIHNWVMRMEERDLVELVVELTPEGVRRCQSEIWLSQSIEVREDGAGVINTQISESYLSWAAHFFLGFGLEAHVHRPVALRGQIVRLVQELSNQYRS